MGRHGYGCGPGRRRHVGTGTVAAPSYAPETTAYLAAMAVQPGLARAALLDALIVGLKADGLWAKLDWLMICAAHDEQAGRINAANPAQIASAPVAPTFTTDRGFTGNGSTQYLNSGFDPASGSQKFTQNDAHMGVWIGTNVQSSAQFDLGNTRATIVTRTSGGLQVRHNNATGVTKALGAATSVGHSVWTRTGATASEMFKEGASIGTDTAASVNPTTGGFLICAASNSGTPGSFSTRRVQAAHWGSKLASGEVAMIRTRLAAYMSAVGA